jgi:hypothetical protein
LLVGFAMRVASALCLAIPTVALAMPAAAIPEANRNPADPIALHVIVPQVEIRASINAAGGGGGGSESIVGALIVGAMESSRAKKAEDKAEQIRMAVEGFDADAIVKREVARAFSGINWINGSKASFAKNPTLWGKMAVLDGGTAPQMASLIITYEMTPDLRGVGVSAVVELVDKVNPKAKKPEKRFLPERVAFVKGAHTIASLAPDPSGKPIDSVAAWTANDGKLLKQTLTESIAKVADLSARAIQLRTTDMAAFNDKALPKMSIGWHRGRIIEGAEALATPETSNGIVRTSATVTPGKPGVLIWAGYFAHTRTLAVGAGQ